MHSSRSRAGWRSSSGEFELVRHSTRNSRPFGDVNCRSSQLAILGKVVWLDCVEMSTYGIKGDLEPHPKGI